MKAIFLADAHLRHPAEGAYRDLLAFLAEPPGGRPDRLYLLGDIFDFRHGWPGHINPDHEPLLSAFADLAGRGVTIIFLSGNHELLPGPRLARIAQCPAADLLTELDGRRIYLTHGDRLDRDNTRYLFWRRFLRSRALLGLIDRMPPILIEKIAARLSRGSRERVPRRQPIPPAVYRSAARILAPGNISALISGHFHQARVELFRTNQGPRPLYLLGAWENERAYLFYEEGRFSFRNYPQ